ncbi:hypothetical protein ACUXQ2_006361 [Cupriavidus metallidurans]
MSMIPAYSLITSRPIRQLAVWRKFVVIGDAEPMDGSNVPRRAKNGVVLLFVVDGLRNVGAEGSVDKAIVLVQQSDKPSSKRMGNNDLPITELHTDVPTRLVLDPIQLLVDASSKLTSGAS